MSSISIFHTGFVICLAGAILFFVITVALFFIFDIKTIFAIRTGRAQAKTVKEMEMVNSSTGRLISGKNSRSSQKKSQKSKAPRKARTDAVIQPPVAAPPAQNEAPAYAGSVTEPLGSRASGAETGSAETALLDRSEETAVLGQSAETAVLGQAAETAVLSQAAETAVLSNGNMADSRSYQSAAPVYFEVIKRIWCHDTDEVIG